MTRTFRFFSVFLTLLLMNSVSVQAETDNTAATQEATKIAVLDWRAALLGTDQARSEFKAIREALSQDEKEIRTLAEEAKQMQAKLKADADTLSADAKRQLSKDIQEKAEEYQ
ncbi:MAG: hypothetical protein R3204_13440, partial [Oceanospirillum sp.]|nr:hypothetical protein [Oceanospirillum sp.]